MGENPEAAIQRLRRGPSLIPSALHLDFGPVDGSNPVIRRRFDGLCRLAKSLSVAVLTMHAAPLGTPMADEVKRLSPLAGYAMREGLVLALLTHSETLTADPGVAVELCQAVPGLGLTLDPSHFLQGPHPRRRLRRRLPYVQNVHLRDTGQAPGEFQVRVGQGEVEYGRIVTMLQRHGYDRALTVAIIDRARQPLRSRGRGPQAQAAAGDLDLTLTSELPRSNSPATVRPSLKTLERLELSCSSSAPLRAHCPT